jgi:hypothetical protein
VDFGIGLLVVPIVVGMLVVAIRMGLPPAYEAPFAMLVGLVIVVGYAAATQIPGGGVFAEAALRGLAIGLSSAGLVAGIRRRADERHVRKARYAGGARRRHGGGSP